MKKILFLLLCTILLVGFNTTNRIEALIEKQIKGTFAVDSYEKEAIFSEDEVISEFPIILTGSNFFRIRTNEQTIGYYYYGQAYGKADYFDFIVILDKDLVVSKVKVLVYREDHGGEIASKRWLKQFIGITTGEKLEIEKDIAGISGATISVNAMTKEVNKVLKTFDLMKMNNIL